MTYDDNQEFLFILFHQFYAMNDYTIMATALTFYYCVIILHWSTFLIIIHNYNQVRVQEWRFRQRFVTTLPFPSHSLLPSHPRICLLWQLEFRFICMCLLALTPKIILDCTYPDHNLESGPSFGSGLAKDIYMSEASWLLLCFCEGIKLIRHSLPSSISHEHWDDKVV